jgi:hypothetical protein
MLLLNKIKTDLNLTNNEFIYEFMTTTRRLERLAAQVEVNVLYRTLRSVRLYDEC